MSEEEIEGTQEDVTESQEEEQETESSDAGEESQDEQSDEVSESGNETDDDNEIDIFSMSDKEYIDFIAKHQSPKQKNPASDNQDKPEQSVKDSGEQDTQKDKTEQKIDYAGFYNDVMAPFTSNGKTVIPRSIDDIRRLMQMGTDYTRKTQALAPLRRIAETVKSAKIDEENLNNLINAYNGDKEAIKRLLKKNKIDPMDFNMDEEDNPSYKPKNNIASQQQVEFSEVLDEIQESIPKIREIIGNKWDEKSRQQLLREPNLLRGLHQEIMMQRFDKIQSVLESEKALGRFQGRSDLEAYVLIAKAYEDYERQKAQNSLANAKKQNDKVEQSNKTKAAPVKQSPGSTKRKNKITDEDLLAMSDKDFMELAKII